MDEQSTEPHNKRRRSSSPEAEHLRRASPVIPEDPLLPVSHDDPDQEKKNEPVSHVDPDEEEKNALQARSGEPYFPPESTDPRHQELRKFMTFEFGNPRPKELTPAMWKELAGHALEYYNKNRAVKLELRGEVSAEHLCYGGIYGFHLDFQAATNDGNSLHNMFAEVFWYRKERSCLVKFCDVMDPSNTGLQRGCRHCLEKVLHPKNMNFFVRPSIEDFPPSG